MQVHSPKCTKGVGKVMNNKINRTKPNHCLCLRER